MHAFFSNTTMNLGIYLLSSFFFSFLPLQDLHTSLSEAYKIANNCYCWDLAIHGKVFIIYYIIYTVNQLL